MTEANGNGSAKDARRKAILEQVGHLDEEPAQLPSPDGPIDVLVRELTGQQAREFETAVAKGADAPLGFLLQQCLIDPETKELIFEPADRLALEQLGIAKLTPVIKVAQRLSGLSDADIEQAKRSLLNAPSIA